MGMECDFVARGETNEEVIQGSMEHAREAHPEKWSEMESNMSMDEIKKELEKHIEEEM